MRYTAAVLATLFTLFFAVQVFAQTDEEVGENTTQLDPEMEKIKKLKWKKKLKVADALFDGGSYYNAVTVYELVWQDKNGHLYTAYKLGLSNYLMRDYENAARWFRQTNSIDSLKYPLSQYYYGQSLKSQGYYGQAKTVFGNFKSTSFKDDGDEALTTAKDMVATDIEGCDMGAEQAAEPDYAVLETIDGVNAPLQDYAPFPFTKESIVFSSLRGDTIIVLKDEEGKKAKDKEEETVVPDTGRYSRFYIAQKSAEGWSSALLNAPFNSGEYHVGNGSFSADKNRFYFTQCTENDDLSMHCQIFMSEKVNGKWQGATALGNGINGEEFTSTQPHVAVNEDGKEVLWFSSDKGEGAGGMDIWYSESDQTGIFGSPTNAGEVINTAGNEVTPFYYADRSTLYFSSNGHVNMGGYDVVSVIKHTDGTWSDVENIGLPVNSGADDIYFTFFEKPSKGYITSNRAGGAFVRCATCGDNILTYRYPPTFVTVEGVLTDNGQPINDVEDGFVYVYRADNDSLIGSFEIGKDGKFKFDLEAEHEYVIEASSKKYFSEQMTIDTRDRDEGEIISVDVDMTKRPYWNGMVFGEVFYDYNKSKLRDDAKPMLDSLANFLRNHDKVIMEIAGHTDSKGDSLYNIKLSERRAEAVYNYLIHQEEIKPMRLTQAGYGEDKPIAPNENPDGTDNPDGRQQNRRTEFTVVGELEVEEGTTEEEK